MNKFAKFILNYNTAILYDWYKVRIVYWILYINSIIKTFINQKTLKVELYKLKHSLCSDKRKKLEDWIIIHNRNVKTKLNPYIYTEYNRDELLLLFNILLGIMGNDWELPLFQYFNKVGYYRFADENYLVKLIKNF